MHFYIFHHISTGVRIYIFIYIYIYIYYNSRVVSARPNSSRPERENPCIGYVTIQRSVRAGWAGLHSGGGGGSAKSVADLYLYSGAAAAAELAGTPLLPAPGVSISILILAGV